MKRGRQDLEQGKRVLQSFKRKLFSVGETSAYFSSQKKKKKKKESYVLGHFQLLSSFHQIHARILNMCKTMGFFSYHYTLIFSCWFLSFIFQWISQQETDSGRGRAVQKSVFQYIGRKQSCKWITLLWTGQFIKQLEETQEKGLHLPDKFLERNWKFLSNYEELL